MNLRLALISVVLCSCATPAPESTAPASGTQAAEPTPTYRTGSRLRTYEESDGSGSTGVMGKDDYMDDSRRVLNR